MAGLRHAGFTIVEITLFMAITGLLFLIALAGTGNAIRSFRFTDSGRQLESFAQKQYDDIVNGLNNRSASVTCTAGAINTGASQTVGSSNCLLIGKLLVFTAGSPDINVYPVIGSEPASVDYSKSDDQLIIAFAPQTVTATGTSTYQIPWQAAPSGFKRVSDNVGTNALLLIRSPKSTNIVSYTFKLGGAVPTDLTTIVSTPANRSQTTNFCIKSADNIGAAAKLIITGGASQSAAAINFNAIDTDCNGI